MVITSDPGAKTRSEPANLLSQMLPHDPAAPAGGGQVDRPPSARGCRAHGSEASQRSVLNAGAGTAEGVCGPSHVRRVTQARRALARLPRRPRPWAASARLRSEGRPRGARGRTPARSSRGLREGPGPLEAAWRRGRGGVAGGACGSGPWMPRVLRTGRADAASGSVDGSRHTAGAERDGEMASRPARTPGLPRARCRPPPPPASGSAAAPSFQLRARRRWAGPARVGSQPTPLGSPLRAGQRAFRR